MASNTRRGFRVGAVRHRMQNYNPSNQRWIKRSTVTGRIMNAKADHRPFKGVRKS